MLLENPLRRRILARIARERHYPLQLSRELRVSQQAIAKHLEVLEKFGLVRADRVPSTRGGPERKNYSSIRHVSLTIDVGPRLFSTEFHSAPDEEALPKDLEGFKEAIEHAADEDDPKARLKKIAEATREMETMMDELEAKRVGLLRLKDSALDVAYSAVKELSSDYEERRVLYHLINESDMRVDALSESLDLREEALRRILRRLEREKLLP